MRRSPPWLLLLALLVLVPGCFRHGQRPPSSPTPVPVPPEQPSPPPGPSPLPRGLQFGELDLAPSGWIPTGTKQARLHLFSSLRVEGEGPPLQLAGFDAGDPGLARRWLVRAFRFGRSEPGLLGRYGVQSLREKDGSEALGLVLGQRTLMIRAEPQAVPLLRPYVLDVLRVNQSRLPEPRPLTRPTRVPTPPPPPPREEIPIPFESYQQSSPDQVLGPDPSTRPVPTRPPPTRRPPTLPVVTRPPTRWTPPTPPPTPRSTPSPTVAPVLPSTPIPSPTQAPPRTGPEPSLEARILLDQGRRLEARDRIEEALGQYRRALALGSVEAADRIRALERDFPGVGTLAMPTATPTANSTPPPTRPVTPRPAPTPAPSPTATPTPEPPTPREPTPQAPTELDELALLRRDALMALAGGDPARAHRLLTRAGVLGDAQAQEEARRLEERYPELRPRTLPEGPALAALERARAAEERGELRAAYSEYLRSVELGSQEGLRALRALERKLQRQHFELSERAWSGQDPAAERQLQDLVRRFPEVFAVVDPGKASEPAVVERPWMRWALLLLCVLAAGVLLHRARRPGRRR